ncbi:MAG TPA: tRNA (N(6)-L-threonylcarbamoyladenosine(37)-C(2))-methylthiotransferase MtaB [Terriglobales bacterium]|nr:tRNA (N(6)-L-threonylcarbamoyladenosine(37)-C(2))-methylthiotransferase MtaB [Terriglobales bacterium]
MPSFYVENFGCRATQADGAAIEEQFRQRGLDRADQPSRARFVVLNTCAVTASAEQDARSAIRRARRENPECEVIVTGCYAQRAPREIAELPGVSLVIGNSHKHNLAQIALNAHTEKDSSGIKTFIPVAELSRRNNSLDSDAGSIFVSDIFAHTELLAAPVFDCANERTRPNLKVQDGCNNRCSFCVIPSLRGRSRSLNLDDVVRQVNELVASGYREVVISGINLGRWGQDLESSTWGGARPRPSKFEDLVRAILDETPLEKLRISSVEPMDWSDFLIRLMAESPRIAKHAHVAMQSGSDAVLRRMHRKYRPWHYREKIEKIRAVMPTAAIGADVMVGFPGETDSEFEETRCMVEELPFTYLHVFTFSARPGTPAASMLNQVPVRIARERNRILREIAAKKKVDFMRSFIGRELQAITLNISSENASGVWTEALTDNYLKMKLAGQRDANQWLTATVVAVDNEQLIAIPAEAKPEILFPSIASSSHI